MYELYKIIETKGFTAIIHPTNLRDVNSLSPKVLLTDVVDNSHNIVRDHTYVEYKRFRKKKYKNKTLISFKGDTYYYKNSKGEVQIGIKNIRCIKEL